MKKMNQVNTQLDNEDYAIFLDIADGQNLKPSALLGKIAKNYIHFYYYKIQRGDITLSQPVLKKFFESLDPKKYDTIAEYNSKYMVDEIKAQEGKVTYDILVDHCLKWNKGNHILFKKIENKVDKSDMFVSKHNICRAWSEIQCKTYAKAFKLIGQTVLEMDYDSDESFSLEVTREKYLELTSMSKIDEVREIERITFRDLKGEVWKLALISGKLQCDVCESVDCKHIKRIQKDKEVQDIIKGLSPKFSGF